MSSPQDNLRKLINHQRQHIESAGNYGKLTFEDIKRIDRYIQCDIFNAKTCCVYLGETKKKYATISFQRKKVSVLRLLYHNYVAPIEKKDIHTHRCENSGVCCNLNHFYMKDKPDVYKRCKNSVVASRLQDLNIQPYAHDPPESHEEDEDEDDDIFSMDD